MWITLPYALSNHVACTPDGQGSLLLRSSDATWLRIAHYDGEHLRQNAGRVNRRAPKTGQTGGNFNMPLSQAVT